MKQYEVTFIVDPVLSGGEINATAQTYVDHLQKEGCNIVHVDEAGLMQLAYPIKKRTTGIYYTIEFQTPDGTMIPKLELALRRDERIMRFLSVYLDKYGVKYNDDKRNGLIGRKKEATEAIEPPTKVAKPKSTESTESTATKSTPTQAESVQGEEE